MNTTTLAEKKENLAALIDMINGHYTPALTEEERHAAVKQAIYLRAEIAREEEGAQALSAAAASADVQEREEEDEVLVIHGVPAPKGEKIPPRPVGLPLPPPLPAKRRLPKPRTAGRLSIAGIGRSAPEIRREMEQIRERLQNPALGEVVAQALTTRLRGLDGRLQAMEIAERDEQAALERY